MDKNDRIKIKYKFIEISKSTEESIKNIVKKNIALKSATYLAKYMKSESSEILLNVNIEKNKIWKYNWKFLINLDGHSIPYSRDGFEIVYDLVQHFFDHVKEQISKKS